MQDLPNHTHLMHRRRAPADGALRIFPFRSCLPRYCRKFSYRLPLPMLREMLETGVSPTIKVTPYWNLSIRAGSKMWTAQMLFMQLKHP
jgi:hypothetical protein